MSPTGARAELEERQGRSRMRERRQAGDSAVPSLPSSDGRTGGQEGVSATWSRLRRRRWRAPSPATSNGGGVDVTRQEGSAALPIGERPPEARRSRCRRHRRITGHGDVRERILRNEPTTVNRPRPFASPRVAHISVYVILEATTEALPPSRCEPALRYHVSGLRLPDCLAARTLHTTTRWGGL